VAYFSPNGLAWQYAGTIEAAGGWSPGVVKGSDHAFVVTGTSTAGKLVAYTSTGTGATWQPTGPLGDAATETVTGATVAPTGTVIATGHTTGSEVSQQPVFLEANPAGSVRPVSLSGMLGASIPELAVNSLAVDGSEQIAVGSADGYPAVWRKAAAGSWVLVSSLSSVSAEPRVAALTSVTHGPAGWLAVGVPGPIVLTSADGTTWRSAGGSISSDLAGVSAVAAAAGPAGYITVGKLVAPGGDSLADVWWSSNLKVWTRARDVNDASGSSQVLGVAADAHGFVSVGSHDSKPAVWTTADGRTWTTKVLPLPAGASSAVLQQVAVRGDRVVAMGEQVTAAGTMPLAEISADRGASWQQVRLSSPGPGTAITALTADADGFTAMRQFGELGQQDVAVWTSADGTSWTQSRVSGLSGPGVDGIHEIAALVSSGSTVTGTGSIESQLSQKSVILTLPARR
jgi:hypothetical protein